MKMRNLTKISALITATVLLTATGLNAQDNNVPAPENNTEAPMFNPAPDNQNWDPAPIPPGRRMNRAARMAGPAPAPQIDPQAPGNQNWDQAPIPPGRRMNRAARMAGPAPAPQVDPQTPNCPLADAVWGPYAPYSQCWNMPPIPQGRRMNPAAHMGWNNQNFCPSAPCRFNNVPPCWEQTYNFGPGMNMPCQMNAPMRRNCLNKGWGWNNANKGYRSNGFHHGKGFSKKAYRHCGARW